MIIYLVVPYLAVMLIMAALQRSLMYRPTRAADLSVAASGLSDRAIEDVSLTTHDGETLRGWLLHPPGTSESASGLVIYFPGNAQHRLDRLPDLQEIASYGFDVLIFDYRGYGDSTGSPSEAALSADARAIWDFAINELGRAADQIVVFGESLGGAVTLSLWSGSPENHPQPAGVILNSTFASMGDTVAWHYPMFPFRWLLLDQWPSIERIAHVKCPTMVFHGTADEIVPVEHGRLLARTGHDVNYVEIPDGHHNGIPMDKLRIALQTILP